MSDNTKLTKQLPLVCTRGVVVFPEQEVIIDVGRSKSVHAVEDSQNMNSEPCVRSSISAEWTVIYG